MPTPSSSFQIVYTSGWVYTSVLTYCLEGWEKLKDYCKANEIAEILLDQKLYCEHKRGHWLDRYTLNLVYHLGDKNKVLIVWVYKWMGLWINVLMVHRYIQYMYGWIGGWLDS